MTQHEAGKDVDPIRQRPRLDGERVVGEEREVGRRLRRGAGSVHDGVEVVPPPPPVSLRSRSIRRLTVKSPETTAFSQIAYRLAGGANWVSAATSMIRWRANLEGQADSPSEEVP